MTRQLILVMMGFPGVNPPSAPGLFETWEPEECSAQRPRQWFQRSRMYGVFPRDDRIVRIYVYISPLSKATNNRTTVGPSLCHEQRRKKVVAG